uniref:Jerky protein homolog-like n=1 Tax=Saccoglossus kowalevskii TaxID=10224 RepID=A0ABM0LX64_SACKO
MACANAAGTHKLPLVVIGKSKNPRCFKHVNMNNLPIRYFNQTRAWMSGVIFYSWFHGEFVPGVKRHLRQQHLPERALQLLDNAPSHPDVTELRSDDGAIKCLFMPPNTMPLLQPMDQGVLNATKRRYKGKMLRKVITENAVDEHEKTLTDCIKSVNLKDACYMIGEAWAEISEVSLKNAWHKLKINLKDSDAVAFTEVADEIDLPDIASQLGPEDRNAAIEWMETEEDDPGFQVISDAEIIHSVQQSTTHVEENQQEDGYNSDKENEPCVRVPTDSEAADMLSKCVLWLEAQPDCESTQLLLLRGIHKK